MNHPVEDLIGPSLACQMLGLDLASLLQSIDEGVIPAYLIGEFIRFRPSELRHPAFSGLSQVYRPGNRLNIQDADETQQSPHTYCLDKFQPPDTADEQDNHHGLAEVHELGNSPFAA